MRLNKKIVSLICLASMMVGFGTTSRSSIEYNSNLISEDVVSVINAEAVQSERVFDTKVEEEQKDTYIKEESENKAKGEKEEGQKEEDEKEVNKISEDQKVREENKMSKVSEEQEVIEEQEINEISKLNEVQEKIALMKANIESSEIDRKEAVTYLRSDTTKISGITEDEMKKVLLSYKPANSMAHLAGAFVDAEREYGVNAFFMSGIVALESGYATSRRAIEDNNLTGYEVYSDDSEGKLFTSQYESVMQTASHLSNNYLKEGAMYYNGLSVDAVQISYCPDEGLGKAWEVKVDKIANTFLGEYKKLY